MLFYYADRTLWSGCRIKGLTKTVNGWTVDNWWRDPEFQNDDEDLFWNEDCAHRRYYVASCVSRSAAEMIVQGLGGYLVPDVLPHRQLAEGGPFFIHRFRLYGPESLGRVNSLSTARDIAEKHATNDKSPYLISYRIYDSSGYMVWEIKPEDL